MPIQSYCFVIQDFHSAGVKAVKEILIKENLIAKAAVLKSVGESHTMEVVVADVATIRYIATVFEKKTGQGLLYSEHKFEGKK